MKKHISIVIVVAISAVVLVFVFKSNTPEGPLRIGTILSLTGSHAYYSEEALRGMKLAKNDIETNNNTKIDLVVEDIAGKSNQAASAALKLIDQDKVSSIVTFAGASAALAITPISNSKKIIQMELVCYAPGCHTKDDYLFRVSGGAEVEPNYIADTLIHKGIKNIFILHAKNDFGISGSSLLEKRFVEQGGIVVQRESFVQDESDFRSHILKINSQKDVEYVVFIGFGEIKNFLKQAKDLEMNLPVFATQTAENPDVLKTAGEDGVKNLIYSYPGKIERVQYVHFKDRYVKEYGMEPSYAAFKGYDALMVLFKATLRCSVHDSACIKAQLESIKNYEGVSNVISFDEYGDISGEEFYVKRYASSSGSSVQR